LGMSQQEDEADLLAIEEVYLSNRGEFLLGFVDEVLVAMGGFKWLSNGRAELRRMRIQRDLQGRGVDLNKVQNDFVQMAYEQMRTQAERDVRGAILLDKIAAAEKVEVADAEIDEEIGKMAEYYKTPPEQVKESIEKQNGIDNIRNNLKTRKAIEALIDKAKISDGPWVDEHIADATADSDEVKTKTPSKKKPKVDAKVTEKAEKKDPKKKAAKSKA